MQVRFNVKSLGGTVEHLVDFNKLTNALSGLGESIKGDGELILPNDDGATETVIKSRSIISFEVIIK